MKEFRERGDALRAALRGRRIHRWWRWRRGRDIPRLNARGHRPSGRCLRGLRFHYGLPENCRVVLKKGGDGGRGALGVRARCGCACAGYVERLKNGEDPAADLAFDEAMTINAGLLRY